MVYLVDSDWIIEALDGSDSAVQFLAGLAPEGMGVSIISYGEVYQGAYYSRDSANDLRQLERFLIGKQIVGLDVEVVRRFARLRGALSPHALRQVGDLDLLIAATAIEHDLILLTRNVRDFRLIPGVRLFESKDPE